MTDLFIPGDLSADEELWLAEMGDMVGWSNDQRNPRKAMSKLSALVSAGASGFEDDGERPKFERLRTFGNLLNQRVGPHFVDIDVLAERWRAAGLTVIILPGAHTRAARMYRNVGYKHGVTLTDLHHTAQGLGWSDRQSIDYLTFHAPYPVMANIYPGKDGRIWILAAGATYTAGRHPEHGHLKASKGNEGGWSWEMPNNGIGERWAAPLEQMLPRALAIQTQFFIETEAWPQSWGRWYMPAHYELTTRKIDPYGPSRWNDYRNDFWNMNRLRRDVRNELDIINRPADEPKPDPIPTVEDDHMIKHLNLGQNLIEPNESAQYAHDALADHTSVDAVIHIETPAANGFLTSPESEGVWVKSVVTTRYYENTPNEVGVKLAVINGAVVLANNGPEPVRVHVDVLAVHPAVTAS